ncbi:hypothetical protein Q8G35_07920 [Peribacillus simplex]|uniref:Uncharacterized protein n=2 Tax=Peribacillus TaxID=2675229 RepID=A0AA90T290_9BACI|nr:MULTISPECIES: hypothetical protein [Peribacillus]MDP1418337.1 hypothetical protein [Peribacillus simplex]MDP1451288.1 hypothetical protein [Peribacillus frigoritolerans]
MQRAYVTKRGERTMTVLSSYNGEEEIIPEGTVPNMEGHSAV